MQGQSGLRRPLLHVWQRRLGLFATTTKDRESSGGGESHPSATRLLVHAATRSQAEALLEAIRGRSRECRWEVHPDKTKIVYGQDSDRQQKHEHTKFDFLGYTFRPRRAKDRWGKPLVSFLPAISDKAARSIRATVRSWRLGATRNNQSLEEIARFIDPYMRGWVNYYGRYDRSAMTPVFRHLERALVYGVRRKFKRFRYHQRQATRWLGRLARREPNLLALWQVGIRRRLDPKSRMSGEVPVRICEGAGVRFPRATRRLTTVERLEKAGVALHVVDPGGNAPDTTSAAGRFMLVVLAGAAEMERNLTRERTRSAMAVKRGNGQPVGIVPYGFNLATDGATLVPNEAEQAVIGEIRTMRAARWTLERIAAALTARRSDQDRQVEAVDPSSRRPDP